MSKSLTHLAWYLERKWKYRWTSCHYTAVHLTKLGTVFVLVLFLWLVYISVWAATLDLSEGDPGGGSGVMGTGVRGSAINAAAYSNNFLDNDVDVLDSGNNDLSGFPGTGSATLQNGRGRGGGIGAAGVGNIMPGGQQSTESEAIPFKTMISYEAAASLTKGINVNGTFITLSLPQFTRLERIFYRADTNRDGFLTESELAAYINQAVKDHLANAMKFNYQRYSTLDNDPRNGLVTWKEYVTHYFKKIGIPAITLDDVRDKTAAFTKLPKDFKVEIARLEASWSEAANNSPDFVTVDEFLSLEHPEASPTRLLTLVTDVFSTFDLDGDGTILKSEFETTYREAEGVDKVYKEDFKIIDTDRNEKISRLELMKYIDPRNIHHAIKDSQQILQVTDLDKDGKMSLHEAIICGAYLIRSKFYDVVYRLHNPE